MAKQITDNASKAIAAAADILLLRDVTSNTDKYTTTAGLATAVAANLPAGSVMSSSLGLSKTVDANGWTVYNYGAHKVYNYRQSFSVTKVSGEYVDLTAVALPVGISTVGTNAVRAGFNCNVASDTQSGSKLSLTSATTLIFGFKCLASTTFIGWVDWEIRG